MKKFLDPDFAYHLAIGRLWGLLGLAIADSPILPFRVDDEATALAEFVDQLRNDYGQLLVQNGVSLGTSLYSVYVDPDSKL